MYTIIVDYCGEGNALTRNIMPPTSVHTVELMCQAIAFRLLQKHCTKG